MRRLRYLHAATCIAFGLAAAIVLAKPGVLVTRDGRKLEGEITEKENQATVTIHGVETVVPKEEISSLNYPEAFNKEFADRMAKLDAKDVNGRIALARWAFDQRQYGKAREALDSASAIDPNNKDAADLQTTISSQIRLEQTRAAGDTRSAPTPPPNPIGTERRMLSANDINIIRQKELQASDQVSVRFLNNVEKRYMQFNNLQFSQFNALKPVDKALEIMDKGDESMRADVKILGDPAPLAEFRRVIQPMILGGCAAANCHGGAKGGALILYNPADNDQASYTNLYVLSRYARKVKEPTNGVFGSADHRMIDRGQGARSLLAQYALPMEVAEQDHPKVQGYNGMFRTPDDLRFKQLTNWMDRSLKPIAPDYGIKFDPPTAASQPTTAPAKDASAK